MCLVGKQGTQQWLEDFGVYAYIFNTARWEVMILMLH
jgi:hypothetical protein